MSASGKSTVSVSLQGAAPLLPYQEKWIADDSRLKIAVWSRQSGKSFAISLRAVMKCLEVPNTRYIMLSAGERQSKLLMEKAQDHIRAIGVVSEYYESNFMEGTLTKQLESRFGNGSTIYALPANPETARGYSGHVVLDEFAMQANGKKIYAACYPIITRGYSLEVASTPNGQAGEFFEIAKPAGVGGYPRDPKSAWSAHRVDVYQAIEQGLARSVGFADDQFLRDLRAGCEDDETWMQEYECAFLSDAQNYIPVELISTCVHSEATDDADYADLKGRELYLGVDIGRKRDLTIMWLFEKLGDVLWSRIVRVFKGVTFDVQERALYDLLDLEPRRCGIDQSGIGMMMAEHAVQKYGAMVEPVTFTQQIKERLAPMVKQAFEDRTVRIPDNREVRADINSVKRFVTPAGNVRFDAEHTDKGHADRFWALAMVVNAATQPNTGFEDCAIGGAPVTAGFHRLVL